MSAKDIFSTYQLSAMPPGKTDMQSFGHSENETDVLPADRLIRFSDCGKKTVVRLGA